MSRMVKINESLFVAADQIAELSISRSSQTIVVRMKDGSVHSRAPEYKQSVYTALDALVEEVNSAASQQAEGE